MSDALLLGYGRYHGRRHPVYLPDADRVTHMLILGRARTGKSKLAVNLALQDIAAGRCVIVIDPHGGHPDGLLRPILRRMDARRKDDVVVLDFGNLDYPVPFNLLRSNGGQVMRLVNIISHLFGEKDGPNVSAALRAALLTLAESPTATLSDVSRLFSEDAYRATLLSRVRDPDVLAFWKYQYEPSNLQTRATQYANPTLNRFRFLSANPSLRLSTNHPHMIDFRQLIRQRKVILISLETPYGAIPDDEANLLGEILISEVLLAAMDTANGREPINLYIDEASRFASTSLDIVMSQSPKYQLYACLIHQYLDQLSPQVSKSVLGNIGTLCSFAVGVNDMGVIERYTAPTFSGHDLRGLDRFEAVVQMQVNARTQPPFSLYPVPPPQQTPQQVAQEQAIRAHSVACYTPMTREQVLAWGVAHANPPQAGFSTTSQPPSDMPPPTDGFVPTGGS
jgi:hypothetical protein